MINLTTNVLYKAFPFPNKRKDQFWISVFSGAYVFVFLVTFQPFELKEIIANSIEYLVGNAVITFTTIFLSLSALTSVFKDTLLENSTVGRVILLFTTIIILVGCMNWLYASAICRDIMNYLGLLKHIYFALTVGSLPAIFIILYIERRLGIAHQKNEQIGYALPEANTNFEATKEVQLLSKNQTLHVSINELLCIRANGNYIEVFFLKDGTLNKKLLRQSLSEIADQVKQHQSLKHCHRSFIVNFDKIEKIEGNARNFYLKMPSIDFIIPVSRNFPKSLIRGLKNLNLPQNR